MCVIFPMWCTVDISDLSICTSILAATFITFCARSSCTSSFTPDNLKRFSRAGPRGRGREWATLGVHPLSWLLSNNRLEEVCSTLTKGTFSSRLLLSNQDKGCTPSAAHSLPLPLGPALLNLSSVSLCILFQSINVIFVSRCITSI